MYLFGSGRRARKFTLPTKTIAANIATIDMSIARAPFRQRHKHHHTIGLNHRKRILQTLFR
jgi:hypothetical protein